MYFLQSIRIALVFALLSVPATLVLAQEEYAPDQTVFRAGTQGAFAGPAEYFTGDVSVEMVFPANDTAQYSGAYVTFEPGARTAWHAHPAGQHMVIISGTALTGTRDGKVIEAESGDAIWCPPGIDHWHGATPHASMKHFVITGSLDGENVIWKGKVTDAEYQGDDQREEKSPMSDSALSAKQQAMAPIAAFTASGDLDALKAAIRDGLNAGLTINEIKEIHIHLYAYAGFPRALNGLGTLMAVIEERKARGIEDPAGNEASPIPPDRDMLEFGTEVQTQLAGRPVSGPLFDFAPEANVLLQRHLFGDLFARDVLDFESREIATVSALANMEGVGPQLNAHIGMAANAGLSRAQISALPGVLGKTVGKAAARRAEEAVQTALPPKDESPPRDS